MDQLGKDLDRLVVKGMDSEALYNDMLTGWTKLTHKAQSEHGGARTECLWVNYPVQMRLEG